MTKIINNFEEIRNTDYGHTYMKDATGEIRMTFLSGSQRVEVIDLKNGVKYSINLNSDIPSKYFFYKDIILGNELENITELLEYLDIVADYKDEINKAKIMNPFFKPLSGKLEIKSKNGKLTKTQIKKVLQHKDTKVIRQDVYTDDYFHDAQMNYQSGIVLDNLDFLDEIINYFYACHTELKELQHGEITVFTVGYSHTTKIYNKNIVVL